MLDLALRDERVNTHEFKAYADLSTNDARSALFVDRNVCMAFQIASSAPRGSLSRFKHVGDQTPK